MTALRALGHQIADCRPLLFAYGLALLVSGRLDPDHESDGRSS